jgi:GcrA cell cycle regulator
MQHKTTTGNWNDDKTAGLRELWDEGLPTAEIGRRLGITKNAVIGKAWRLGLPPRRVSDSPNPVPSFAEIMPRATDRCHWPFGKPGTAALRFCSRPVLAGKPYCEIHCRIAYVRPPDPWPSVAIADEWDTDVLSRRASAR